MTRNRGNKANAGRPQKGSKRGGFKGGRGPSHASPWLWGTHAVAAALANPRREKIELLATENAARRMELSDAKLQTAKEIDARLPAGAVHQGVALLTKPLEPVSLDSLLATSPARLAVLDQLTDPHNLGAIFRSAAAFGVGGLIMQTRHTPPITGIAAKSAQGGIETVAECRVVNIARVLETLADAGYLIIGLAGDTETVLADALKDEPKVALVLGAEGSGLRPAVAKACTLTAKIPMSPDMESLNVSNAAGIAFYEAARGTL